MPTPVRKRVGAALFRKKLDAVLNTPQGNEIRNRTWRISDQFMGGELRKPNSGLKIDLNEKLVDVEEEDPVDFLTKLELAEEEGTAIPLPLLRKMPPQEKAMDIKKEEYDHSVEAAQAKRISEIQAERVEKEASLEAVTRAKKANPSVIDQFDKAIEKQDYYGAVVIVLAAVFALLATFFRDIVSKMSSFLQK